VADDPGGDSRDGREVGAFGFAQGLPQVAQDCEALPDRMLYKEGNRVDEREATWNVVNVFVFVSRWFAKQARADARPPREPLGGAGAVNPSGSNVDAGFVRVRPVRKASELVSIPVNCPRAVRSSKFKVQRCSSRTVIGCSMV